VDHLLVKACALDWLVRLVLAALIALAPGSRALAQADKDDPAIALEAEVGALMHPGARLRGLRIAWPEQIHRLYSRREFRPAWSDPQIAAQLHRALADSRDDGLDPSDYYLGELTAVAAKLPTLTDADELHAQYDLLNTEALLRLVYHLSFGKVDPRSFDSRWNYGRSVEDSGLAGEIESALGAPDIYERVAALKPTHNLYGLLRQELRRYRAIEAAGGWSPIPAGASLRPGAADARIPALRKRLETTGDLDAALASDSTLYDAELEASVKGFQERSGLAPDGLLGARTLEELNVPVSERIRQLRINLDRGRVLLHDLPHEFVVVNVAAYLIYFMRGREIVWQARAQVGKPYRETPIFRSEITYLVWNPTWTVPPTIIAHDILPEARRDPESIARRGLNVLDPNGVEVDPASVDWARFRTGHIPYTLRQDPGPGNALGRVKFMFPNQYSVYLHDTPSQRLFDAPDRTFSSGCVRVERALELAKLLLNDPARWDDAAVGAVLNSRKTRNVTLQQKMPVLLAYWTAWANPDGIHFRRDIYGQDAKWGLALDEDFTVRAPLNAASQ
jgi:murein L,D-transpeptidase YcbB/YkuD